MGDVKTPYCVLGFRPRVSRCLSLSLGSRCITTNDSQWYDISYVWESKRTCYLTRGQFRGRSEVDGVKI